MRLAVQRAWLIFLSIVAVLAIALCVYLALGGVAFRNYGNYVDNNPPFLTEPYPNGNGNGNGTTNPNGNGMTNPNGNGTTEPNGNGTANPNGNGTTNPNGNGTTVPNGNGASGNGASGNGTTNPNGNGTTVPNGNGTSGNGTNGNGTNGNGTTEPNGVNGETDYKLLLENLYKEIMYSLSDSMNNLHSALEKVSVANGSSSVHRYLLESERYASACAADLTLLPVDYSSESVQGALRFTNQVSDYCVCLAKQIKGGRNLKEADRTRLSELGDIADSFQEQLRDAAKKGDFNFSFSNGGGENGSEEFSTLFEYPALIYDGPFSDAKKGEIKMGKSITEEEGKSKILSALVSYGIVEVAYEEKVDNEATVYVYNAVCADGSKYSIMLTVDGRFLQINGYNLIEAAAHSTDYPAIAKNFAASLGYDVKTMWVSEETQGVVYVNLIYVTEGGVKVYPDMIKTAIDVKSGRVVSFDAFSYLVNHKQRNFPQKYDEYAKAASRLHPKLTMQNRGRAIIPDECANEYICYEFITTRGKDTFYIYIDAKDYTERDILKVVKSEFGSYVM